jgi:hypothetical protein
VKLRGAIIETAKTHGLTIAAPERIRSHRGSSSSRRRSSATSA